MKILFLGFSIVDVFFFLQITYLRIFFCPCRIFNIFIINAIKDGVFKVQHTISIIFTVGDLDYTMENVFLNDYFTSLLTTELVTVDEIAAILKDNNISGSSEDVNNFYNIFRNQDISIREQLLVENKVILSTFKKINVSEFAEKEMKQFFTLDILIDNLYNIGMLLDHRLGIINLDLGHYADLLFSTHEEFEKALNNSRNVNDAVYIGKVMKNLDELRSTIKVLINDRK